MFGCDCAGGPHEHPCVPVHVWNVQLAEYFFVYIRTLSALVLLYVACHGVADFVFGLKTKVPM